MTAPAGILDRLLGAPVSAARPTGLLTADDYAAARRQGLLGLGQGLLAASGGGAQYSNLNQRLAAGLQAGQQAYQQALGQQAAQAQAGQQYDAQGLQMQQTREAMQRQQALEQGRARIIQQNPMPDASDPQAMARWIDQVLPQFIMIGDNETLGKLSEIRKSLGGSVATVNLGDRMQFYNPRTGEKIREEAIAQSPNSLGAGMITPRQQASIVGQIESSFRNYTKDDEAAAHAWAQMDQIRMRAAAGIGAPDDLIGLIDVISKLYNPGAVVRVGTVKITLEKLGSWKQKAMNWQAQGLTGAPDPELVRQIALAASRIAEEHRHQ